MRARRVLAVLFACMLPAAALLLIWLQAKSITPHPLRFLMSRLYRRPPPPAGVTYISRFDRERDFEIWRRRWAQLFPAGEWGRVIFGRDRSYPGIRISDYSFGPARIRDWSDYRWLKWDMLPQGDSDKPLYLTIKDNADRRFTRFFSLYGATESSISIDLAEMVPWIDITHVADIHFYLMSPEKDVTVDFRDLRLVRGGGKPGEVLGTPFVVFEGLEAPARARIGQMVEISVSFSLTKKQDIPYMVFLHLFHEKDRDVPIPARRAGYIHVEKQPFLPVTEWRPGEIQTVGPFYIDFPTFNPAGTYLIRAGLFNVRSGGNGPRGMRYRGAFDYNGTFPKCRYTDPEIKDFVVGSIVVEREKD